MMSAVSTPVERKVPRLRERRRRRLFTYVLVAIPVVGIIGALALWYTGSERFRITTVAVQGNTVVSSEEIIKVATNTLSGSGSRFVPRTSRLWYSPEDILASVQKAFPRIQSVDVAVVHNVLTLTVSERTVYALWCIGTPSTEGPCFVADINGYIFDEAPVLSGDSFIRYFGPLGMASSSPLGETIGGDSTVFHDIGYFLNELSSLDLAVRAVMFADGGDVDFYLQTGGKILAGDRSNFARALQNITTLQLDRALGLDRVIASGTLDYVDVRYGNKVFYKVKK
jgi:hypothetical protein